MTGRARQTPTSRNHLVRLFPLIFAVLLVTAVAVGLWNASTLQQGVAPGNLGAYELGDLVTGPAAVAQMSRLHGKGVGVMDGYVAHYSGPSGGAVLYVGEAASEKDSVELLRQMEERIAAGSRYFAGLRRLTVEGVEVFTVRSGPETHYFWQTGKRVIWIGFDRDDPAGLATTVRSLR